MMKRLVALVCMVSAIALGTAGAASACFPDEWVWGIADYAVDEAVSTATEAVDDE